MEPTTRIVSQDGKVHVERVQDVEPILDHARDLRLAGHVGGSEMRHAAHFPAVLVEKYLNDKGIDLAEFLKNPVHARNMLNDPALALFRVWEGRV